MLPRCLVVCALLLAPPLPSLSTYNVVHFGRNIVLGADQRFHNASCFLCSISVAGRGTGSVRAFAGNVFLEGAVGGSVLVLGGNVTISSTASVGRRVVIVGGQLHQDSPGATVRHTVLPPLIFLPLILLICGVTAGLIVLTRRMVRGPVAYPPLPRL